MRSALDDGSFAIHTQHSDFVRFKLKSQLIGRGERGGFNEVGLKTDCAPRRLPSSFQGNFSLRAAEFCQQDACLVGSEVAKNFAHHLACLSQFEAFFVAEISENVIIQDTPAQVGEALDVRGKSGVFRDGAVAAVDFQVEKEFIGKRLVDLVGLLSDLLHLSDRRAICNRCMNELAVFGVRGRTTHVKRLT
jgi:hypothetical protein